MYLHIFYVANTCAKGMQRKTSQPHLLPSSAMRQKVPNYNISRTPDNHKNIKQWKGIQSTIRMYVRDTCIWLIGASHTDSHHHTLL